MSTQDDPTGATPTGATPGRGGGPSRRNVLLTLLAGTVGGAAVGSALPWSGGSDRSGPGELSGAAGASGRSVVVHGGDDIGAARANALHVWELTPDVRARRLRAAYENVGRSSTEQFDRIRNLLTNGATDLVAIDPQYLPYLVDRGQLAPMTGVDADSLRELGCFPGLVRQCEVGGDLYAVPLNADAPMLVVNLSLLAESDRNRVGELRGTTDRRAFWSGAATLAARATAGPRSVLLQTGDYEGLTVCLVEVLAAFGAEVATDPGLTQPGSRAALAAVRSTFGREPFATPADKGDEAATVRAVRAGAAVARLWPAQCHELTSGALTDEGRGGEFALLPIPGGVLGGQVLAVAADSRDGAAAQALARHLTGPMPQLQLFHGAGYVPTLRQLHADTQVDLELVGLGDRLASASLRPALRDYVGWSARFRAVVRDYLLGVTDDVPGTISRPLTPFTTT